MKNSTVFQHTYLSMSKGIPAAKEDMRHHQITATWSILSNVASSFTPYKHSQTYECHVGKGGFLPSTLQRLGREGCHVGKKDEKKTMMPTLSRNMGVQYGQKPK